MVFDRRHSVRWGIPARTRESAAASFVAACAPLSRKITQAWTRGRLRLLARWRLIGAGPRSATALIAGPRAAGLPGAGPSAAAPPGGAALKSNAAMAIVRGHGRAR